jgi:hypothetical protein
LRGDDIACRPERIVEAPIGDDRQAHLVGYPGKASSPLSGPGVRGPNVLAVNGSSALTITFYTIYG